jgi:hypothetical protein
MQACGGARESPQLGEGYEGAELPDSDVHE